MNRSTLTAMAVAGVLSVSSLIALGQSSGNDAPVDKGGMPPSSEMNADSADGNALPPGSIDAGNAGDANGSSTSPGTGSGSMSGGSSMGSGSDGGSEDSSGSGASGSRSGGASSGGGAGG